MKSHTSDSASGATDILREIDILLEELAVLARSQVSPTDFYKQLLERASFVLSAEGAAVWTLGDANELQISFQLGLSHLKSRRSSKLYQQEISRLQPLTEKPQPCILPSQPRGGLKSWVVASPVMAGELLLGILTVHISEDLPGAVQQGYLHFVAELARITAEYQQHQSLHEWQTASAARKYFSEFCLATHKAWSLQEVASQIANEGRRYIDCDRVGVLLCHGRHSKLLAISGIDAIHSHANLVRNLENLVRVVSRMRQPFFYDQAALDLPPQIETRLQEYMDDCATLDLAIIPLFHDGSSGYSDSHAFSAIVFEQFQEKTLSSKIDQIQAVSQQATIALSRAVRVRNIPLLGFLTQHSYLLKWANLRMWPLWGSLSAIVAMIIALLFFVTAELNIVARGEFQPALQRHVFAASDGTVNQLFVKYGQVIEKGEVVVELRSTDIDLEFQRISGEIAVSRKELLAVRSEQLQVSGFDSATTGRVQVLSARELYLNEQLKSLNLQLDILNDERKRLKLTSPIRGRVQTWELESTLLARPVRRGNILLTVADTEGPWLIRVQVPDAAVGHLLSAAKSSEDPVQVSFMAISDPSKTFYGQINLIPAVTHVDEDQKVNGLLVEIDFDSSNVEQLQAGAAVICKIHCGKRAIGYVWLHEFLEEIDRRFF